MRSTRAPPRPASLRHQTRHGRHGLFSSMEASSAHIMDVVCPLHVVVIWFRHTHKHDALCQPAKYGPSRIPVVCAKLSVILRKSGETLKMHDGCNLSILRSADTIEPRLSAASLRSLRCSRTPRWFAANSNFPSTDVTHRVGRIAHHYSCCWG